MSQRIIYHERQSRQLCALHALNNLFQRRDMFTKAQLDDYCYELSPRMWLNPHCSWLGLGNYDINVIMYAVQQRNCEVIWYDRRRDPHCLNTTEIFGFILNVSIPMSFANYIPLPFRTRHWLALRCIDGSFYNLDSRLPQPHQIGNESNFEEFVREQLSAHKGNELFIIMPTYRNEYDDDRRWLKSEYRNTTTTCEDIN